MKNKPTRFNFTIFLILTGISSLSAQLRFNNLDSLLAYADKNSASSKIAVQQSLLAKWTKVAALANSINFRNPVSFSATNNLQLPVNFLPAEAFGGPAGTFREITLGQKYVSNFNFNPQIDLINPQNWARVKSAEYNKELTEVSNQLTKKALHESIAAAYYNYLSASEQLLSSEQSGKASDSLTSIIKNKYDQGILREQDFNNSKVNNLLIKDKLQQLQTNRDQQLNAIKILCDIPANTALIIKNEKTPETGQQKSNNKLESKYSLLQSLYLKSELKVNRYAMLPVLSLVYYQGWQQNSNTTLFDNKAKWIQSKYIGFKLTMPFPPDVNKLSQSYTNKVNYSVAKLNASHTELQNELKNRSLELDLEKAQSSFEIAKEVCELKNNNYQKSLNQFNEGLLPADILLNAFTDLLNSRLNLAAAHALLNFNQAKLNINNSFK